MGVSVLPPWSAFVDPRVVRLDRRGLSSRHGRRVVRGRRRRWNQPLPAPYHRPQGAAWSSLACRRQRKPCRRSRLARSPAPWRACSTLLGRDAAEAAGGLSCEAQAAANASATSVVMDLFMFAFCSAKPRCRSPGPTAEIPDGRASATSGPAVARRLWHRFSSFEECDPGPPRRTATSEPLCLAPGAQRIVRGVRAGFSGRCAALARACSPRARPEAGCVQTRFRVGCGSRVVETPRLAGTNPRCRAAVEKPNCAPNRYRKPLRFGKSGGPSL